MSKRWLAAVLGLVSAAAMFSAMLAGASPASASIGDSAVAGTPPAFSSGQCQETAASKACFEPYGDKIWVYDKEADNAAAAGYWENYLRDSSGSWDYSEIYRAGQCTNHLGAHHWGYCNYDFYEDNSLNYYGGYGSGLRVYALTEYGPKGDYVWVRNG